MEPISIALALAQFAPSILRFFGAGEGTASTAQKVVNIAQTVAGVRTPEEALQALRANAELAQQFNLAVLAADKDLEQAHLADRQDARARDVEFIKAGRTNTRADVMVAGAVLGLIACLACLVLFRQGLPGEAVGIISTVAGIFGACLRDAFQFEFGSSRSSRDKDSVIDRMASRQGSQP
jgi:hypothetical protein